jgi:hypothetical protein
LIKTGKEYEKTEYGTYLKNIVKEDVKKWFLLTDKICLVKN